MVILIVIGMICTKYYIFEASHLGSELPGLIGGSNAKIHSGFIRQFFIQSLDGGGSNCDVQIRYISGNSEIINSVYFINHFELPIFYELNLLSPFDLKNKDSDNDLFLYLKPEEDGLFKIRIDFDFDRQN